MAVQSSTETLKAATAFLDKNVPSPFARVALGSGALFTVFWLFDSTVGQIGAGATVLYSAYRWMVPPEQESAGFASTLWNDASKALSSCFSWCKRGVMSLKASRVSQVEKPKDTKTPAISLQSGPPQSQTSLGTAFSPTRTRTRGEQREQTPPTVELSITAAHAKKSEPQSKALSSDDSDVTRRVQENAAAKLKARKQTQQASESQARPAVYRQRAQTMTEEQPVPVYR